MDALSERILHLLAADPLLGYRAMHKQLNQEPEFQGVGLKKVQTALQNVRALAEAAGAQANSESAAAPAVAKAESKPATAAGYAEAAASQPAVAAAATATRCAGPGENIWTAASDGDASRVEELITLEGFTPASPDENGYTPVHAAAAWGHVELLRALLARDTGSVNVRDEDGDTPLHHVAGADELGDLTRSVLELLLEHRADPSLQNKEGKTCLDG